MACAGLCFLFDFSHQFLARNRTITINNSHTASCGAMLVVVASVELSSQPGRESPPMCSCPGDLHLLDRSVRGRGCSFEFSSPPHMRAGPRKSAHVC